jgi:hypothetical protein
MMLVTAFGAAVIAVRSAPVQPVAALAGMLGISSAAATPSSKPSLAAGNRRPVIDVLFFMGSPSPLGLALSHDRVRMFAMAIVAIAAATGAIPIRANIVFIDLM